MTRHTDLADGVKATSSRSIHLGGLHPEATREEVASEIERLGYTNCKFLWPKINPGFPEGQTRTDYCFVRFNTRGTADQAMETISQAALSIRGRPVTVKTSKHASSDGAEDGLTDTTHSSVPASQSSESHRSDESDLSGPPRTTFPGHWRPIKGPAYGFHPSQARPASSPRYLAPQKMNNDAPAPALDSVTRPAEQASVGKKPSSSSSLPSSSSSPSFPSLAPALLTMDAFTVGEQGVRINGVQYIPVLAALCRVPRGAELLVDSNLLPFSMSATASVPAGPQAGAQAGPRRRQPRLEARAPPRGGVPGWDGASQCAGAHGPGERLERGKEAFGSRKNKKKARRVEEPGAGTRHEKRIKREGD